MDTEPQQSIQSKGLNRNTIDKYYTKKQAVDLCIELIKHHITITKADLAIEPSAGNGSFINSIKTLTDHCLFYDIEPEHNDIIRQDFLALDMAPLQVKYQTIHFIGNPPFGRQSSSAIKFIKKCCQFSAASISFILPKSFKKESMQQSFTSNYHLIHQTDLPANSFLVNGKEYDVPCVFQIWKSMTEPRNKPIKPETSEFKFVKKEENPDISFRRVGITAGEVSKDFADKNIQSHYFIKFTNDKTVDENIAKLSRLQFASDNTVGPRSISKTELVSLFLQAPD